MSKIKWEDKILKLIKNKDKIPEDFWIKSQAGHEVIWLLSREDGTAGSYETSQERFGITKEGKIIWGFSSGCSCWDGWKSEDYLGHVTWKEFILSGNKEPTKDKNYYDKDKEIERDNFGFVADWINEVEKDLDDFLLIFKKDITPKEALSVGNAELRRYLVKRIGYDKLREHSSITIIATDGEYELIDAKISKDITDRYLKVKDSSTERIFLLGIPNHIKDCKDAVAWTFGLSATQYNPLIET